MAHSFFATSAPETHVVAGTILYSENLHIKALLKKLFIAVVASLIPLLFIIVYGVLGSLAQGATLPPSMTFSITLPPLNPFLVILVCLLWYAGCAYAIVRSLYEWRHTVIELTKNELAVYRPRNILLLLRGPESDVIRAASVVGFQTEKPTLSELLFFHNCITASVSISEIEGNKHSPVDQLADVRNYKAFEAAVKSVSRSHTFVVGG